MKDLNQNTFDSFEINPAPWKAGCEKNEKENDPKVIRPPQSIKLLSTAKNIPRSAFDLPNISNSDRVVQCSEMPPFSENLIRQPEIAFLTLQDDDVSDSRYAKWLRKQIRNPESVENLMTRPVHLKSIVSESSTQRDAEEQRLSNLKNLLNESLYRLLKYPADYNSILTCLMDTIVIGSKGFGDKFMVYVAETIYSTCICDIPFCHIASKLVAEICLKIKKEEKEKGFRTILLMMLQIEYKKKDEFAKSMEISERERLQTLTMFIAELLVNFLIPMENGKPSRIQIFSKLLPSLLTTLMNTPSQSNVRIASQVLRLGVGPIIEIEQNNQAALSEVWHLLSNQARKGNEHAKKVLIHRATGWKSYFPRREENKNVRELNSYEYGRGEPVFFTNVGIPYMVSSLADPKVLKELFC